MKAGLRLVLAMFALMAVGLLPLNASTAGAVTGHAGAIEVSVTPTTRVDDGQRLDIDASAPAGIVIYQITAHLCLPGPNVRTDFDFGFEGQRCTNKPVGRGDVEQSVEYADGVNAGSLDTFAAGEGTVLWVNELGYPKTLHCGPGFPCDVVVRVQITDSTVFFTTPLCYGPTCPTGGTTITTAAPTTPPSTSRPSTTTGAGAPTSTTVVGPGSTRPGGRSTPGIATSTSAPPTQGGSGPSRTGTSVSAAGPPTAGGRVAPGRNPATASGAGRGLSEAARARLSALAGLLAGGWIVSIFVRGESWVAFLIARVRRRTVTLKAL